MNIIITEEQVKTLIENEVGEYVSQTDMDSTAKNDFEDCDFEGVISERYPNRNLEFDIDSDGTVTVTDLDTEKQYTCQAKLSYEPVFNRVPSGIDPYSEKESIESHYDFTSCLREIMRQMDEE